MGQNLRMGLKKGPARDLFDLAIQQGWTASVMGDGHIRLSSPTGSSAFFLSTTAKDGNFRAHRNNRAAARRAGLDV
jgi:hypothetical protein